MTRPFALSFGCLAMVLTIVGGLIDGRTAGSLAGHAVLSLAAYSVVGLAAGSVADRLIRQSVQAAYRRRVDWFIQSTTASNNDLPR